MLKTISGGRARVLAALFLIMAIPCAAVGDTDEPRRRVWGFGWDDGLTVRRWLGDWELSLAAGPDDYLRKSEQRTWDTEAPDEIQGALEVPDDDRREEGWVRLQAGYRVATYKTLAAVVYTGLVYNWEDSQYSYTSVDYEGLYHSYDADRFTHRWLLELGFRPSWRPVEFLSIETAFGLRFAWNTWSETETRSWDNGERVQTLEGNGDFSSFTDFGWDGMSSLKFIVWF